MVWFINFWVILHISHYIAAIFALVKLAKTTLETGDKIGWSILVLLVPLIGSVVFLIYSMKTLSKRMTADTISV